MDDCRYDSGLTISAAPAPVLHLSLARSTAQAIKLNRELDAVQDRYGRNQTGQSLLLARRLVEVGAPVVQTNIGAVQTWDNHGNIFPTLNDRLLPPLNQGVAAHSRYCYVCMFHERN